jgi:hypothetical protein
MSDWPELRIEQWRETYATLLLEAQIIGKIRLGLTQRMNEWWNTPLYVTARGLTTSPMPYGGSTFSIDLDLIDHRVVVQAFDGKVRTIPLTARPVAEFHAALFGELRGLGIEVVIDPRPQECPVTTPLHEIREHGSYDAGQARRFFEALRRIEPVFQSFRAGFRGKCSPVHFFWGAFDLAVTRFTGRPAPPRKGLVERLAYDEEVASLGFWPGDPWTGQGEAAFYAYTVPEPPGLAQHRAEPDGAVWSEQLKEHLLPYDVVRRSADPARDILTFAQSCYDAGARLGGWDAAALAYRG